MLKMRTCGKAGVWSIRGTVSPGDRKIRVPEFSTWATDEDAGAFLMEIELRERLMFGGRAIVAKATVADALDAYLNKAPKPHSTDVVRVEVIRGRIGQMSLGEPKAAWNAFRDAYLLGKA